MNDSLSEQLAVAYNKKNPTNKTKHNNKYTQLKRIQLNEKDGVDHINISLSGKTEIGRFISPEYAIHINTPIGVFSSMDIFMRYINTPDLPSSLNDINSVKIFYKKYKQLNLKKVFVPNYWALVTAGLICKIKSSTNIENKLKKSTAPITSYRIEKPKSILDLSPVKVINMNDYRVRYVKVVENIRSVLKKYRNPELQKIALHRLIIASKENVSFHLYEAIPFLSDDDKTGKELTLEELDILVEEKEKELDFRASEARIRSKENYSKNKEPKDKLDNSLDIIDKDHLTTETEIEENKEISKQQKNSFDKEESKLPIQDLESSSPEDKSEEDTIEVEMSETDIQIRNAMEKDLE